MAGNRIVLFQPGRRDRNGAGAHRGQAVDAQVRLEPADNLHVAAENIGDHVAILRLGQAADARLRRGGARLAGRSRGKQDAQAGNASSRDEHHSR